MRYIPAIFVTALLAAPLACPARDATFAWDANPAADAVTSYRLERQDAAAGAWLELATVVDQGTGLATELRVPDFPDAATAVRVLAVNAWGDGPPSDPLLVEATPGQVQGLRFSLTGRKVAAVSISEPGEKITVEISADLVGWRVLATGWSYVVATVPRADRAFFRAWIRPA